MRWFFCGKKNGRSKGAYSFTPTYDGTFSVFEFYKNVKLLNLQRIYITMKTVQKLSNKTVTVLHPLLVLTAFTLMLFSIFLVISSRSDIIGGWKSFVVTSDSMKPYFSRGSILFTQKSSQYLPGDIISFTYESQSVTHRITEVYESIDGQIYFQTKGDGNKYADEILVPASSVIGKMRFEIPQVGNLVLHLKTINGFMTFIVLPSLAFIGLEIWAMSRNLKSKKDSVSIITPQQEIRSIQIILNS